MNNTMNEVVVVAGKRTATGNFLGSLKDFKAYDLEAECIKAMMEETKIPGEAVDEAIIGNQFQAGNNANPARWAALRGGLPEQVPAFTPMKNCGTGLKSIVLGVQSIQTGNNDVVVAGGMEVMSGCPYYLMGARQGYRMGHANMRGDMFSQTVVRDGLFEDGLFDPVVGGHMGLTAETLAKHYNIDRKEQDEFALESHRKAVEAWNAGKYKDDVVPIEVKQRGKVFTFDRDETFREGLTMADLEKLKPAFVKDGTVTPGNASPLNDGAAAVMLMTPEKAKEFGLQPVVKFIAATSVGYDPKEMGAAPINAVKKLVQKTGLKLEDFGLMEFNEAFAVQALTCIKGLGIEHLMDRINVNGGAVALGHATGCTGARLTITLMNEMKRRGVKYGLETLCIGGGQGIAIAYELCE